MTSHLNTSDGISDLHMDEIDRPMMSIKDRIRAMNLVAERSSSVIPSGHSSFRGNSPDAKRSKTGTTACDLSTLTSRNQKRKPTGLSSDPGVRNDEDMAASAIHLWRKRRGDENKVIDIEKSDFEECDDANEKVAEWTISDLTKGIPTRKKVQTPVQQNLTDTKHTRIQRREDNPIRRTSSESKLENHKFNLRNGRTSPILPQGSMSQQNEAGFVMPKLKQGNKAAHTLALVNALTSPQRNGTIAFNSVEIEGAPSSAVLKSNRNAVSMSPSRIVGDGTVQLQKSERSFNAPSRINIKSNDESESNELGMRSSPLGRVRLKKVGRNASRSNVPDGTLKPRSMHNQQMDKNLSHHSVSSDIGIMSKKKFGTPQRSKISDRIKAFSSAANGSNWKNPSPARYPVQPSAPYNSSTAKRQSQKFGQHLGEDSSCASSERQSHDDDSVSVSTPMMGTPARLGAHPPTPNSYNSETVYTSVASSGDGAVAGSFASSEQNLSNQMNYAHVSTPSSSLQGDGSTASPKHGQIIETKPIVKNTLQSKLEYDKQRAARQKRAARNQMKVPSALVSAQKKAQDEGPKQKWGTKLTITDITPTRSLQRDTMSLTATPTSLDEDPTMLDQSFDHSLKCLDKVLPQNVLKSGDEIDSLQVVRDFPPSKCKREIFWSGDEMDSTNVEHEIPLSKSKSEDTAGGKPSVQMKADVMKLLINKRRRRRKEIQIGKKDNGKDMTAALASPKRTSIGEYCVRNRGVEKKHLSTQKKIKTSKALPISAVNFTAIVTGKKEIVSFQEPTLTSARPEEKVEAAESEPERDLKIKGTSNPLKKSTSIQDKLKNIKKEKTFTSKAGKPPTLPPDIVRSTQHQTRKEADQVALQVNEENKNVLELHFTPTDESTPASPSNSISVASSLLEEYPDDEDEPEPVVDSFIDMDLSPIRTNDVSKHVFDTSTSYRGSPESVTTASVNSPEQSPHRPGHIRDLIVSQSTPKRANRHASLRNVGEMLYSPKGTHLDYSFSKLSAATPDSQSSRASPVPLYEANICKLPAMKPSFVNSDSNILESKLALDDPVSTFRNHCADAFSDISSGVPSLSNASATSSTVSAIAFKANKILSERRAKSKKKPDLLVSTEKTHAANLARKIMYSEQESSPTDSSRKTMRGKEAIKEALVANRSSDLDKIEKEDNKSVSLSSDKGDQTETVKKVSKAYRKIEKGYKSAALSLDGEDKTEIIKEASMVYHSSESDSNKKAGDEVAAPSLDVGNQTKKDLIRHSSSQSDDEVTAPSSDEGDQTERNKEAQMNIPSVEAETVVKEDDDDAAPKANERAHVKRIKEAQIVIPNPKSYIIKEEENDVAALLSDEREDENASWPDKVEVDVNDMDTVNDFTSSYLDMDVEKIDRSLQSAEGSFGLGAGCMYPLQSHCRGSEASSWLQIDKLSPLSQGLTMICGDDNDVETSNSLDVSTISAVRISQCNDDDAVPFNEGKGAIEVEYISNEDIATASRALDNDDSFLMHITSDTGKDGEGYFTNSPNASSTHYNEHAPNYVSESSCDTSSDVDYHIPVGLLNNVQRRDFCEI